MVDLKRVAVFANPNGHNEYCLQLAAALGQTAKPEVQVISLAERLAEYTRFPSFNRKTRLEEILQNAAKETAKSLTEKMTASGLSCGTPQVLTGKFPEAVETWLKDQSFDLVVKQSLPCDGEFGHASKGDLRLSRHVSTPILLLHADSRSHSPILVAVPPIFQDESGLGRAARIVQNGYQWSQILGGAVHFVHAWELFGESFLRSRETKEELNSELATAKDNAEQELQKAIAAAKLPGEFSYHTHVLKGDPTRVLLAHVELQKPSLVVMGSVANEGVKGLLLGNTAETIVRRKLTNTLIVK